MRITRLLLLTLLSIGYLLQPVSADNLSQNKIFPLPEKLVPNVKFWIKVYTEYSNNQIILHDNRNLDIIYEVIDEDQLFNGKNVSQRKIWKKIEKIKDEYRSVLRSLARKKITKPESLEGKERKVYELFGCDQNPKVYLNAVYRIRAQNGLCDHFEEGLKRSGRYMKHIQDSFRKYNLPLELTALPHVESSFNNNAYSKFGAAGLWQFTRSTGRLYLNINYTVDERFHPEIASDAAARLLRDNYRILKSWPLALTAYNHGVNGMKRAVRRLGTKDFGVIAEKYKSRRFGFASRNFYAEFLAALHVSENYKKFFGDIEFDRPDKFSEIEIPFYIKLATITNKLDIAANDIKKLNPDLRRSVLRSSRRLPKGYKLRIPYKPSFDPQEFYAQIPGYEKLNKQVDTNWYRVRRGDNLRRIAQQFNTTVDEIIALNDDIVNSHRIYVNQILRLPVDKVTRVAKAPPKSVRETLAKIDKSDKSRLNLKWHQIKRGDNLENISKKYDISVDDLMAMNDISNKHQIYAGQMIRLRPDKTEQGETELTSKTVTATSDIAEIEEQALKEVTPKQTFYTVEPKPERKTYWYEVKAGDNLKTIAADHDVPIDALIRINNIENKHRIRVGQTLIIPPVGDGEELAEDRSQQATQQILADIGKSASKNDDSKSDNINKKLSADQSNFSIEGKVFVMPDETLGHLADWLEIPTQKLRELNGLAYYQEIQLGQQIKIVYANVSKDEFNQKRMEYHRSIEEDFFSTYRVAGVQTHKLKRGENIWYLSNEVYEIPYWLLVKYNPNANFNRLRYGDEIIIPIVVSISNS